jgi:GTP-binding protein
MDFRYKRKYTAPNGEPGGSKICSGKSGEDLVIRVPNGTVIRDAESGGIIKDMSGDVTFVLARGGNGGWGNQHFATPTRQAPRFAKAGLPGGAREVTLELKLLADVGLIGFPNVGKSTLLSVVSKAHPKIADYPFTTLFPNLGIVYVAEEESFVMADIPGLIEGASGGAGLGHDFLRHVDRCRLFIHIVDVSGLAGRDPIQDFETINAELRTYNPALADRPQLVAANKCDLCADREPIESFRAYIEERGLPFFELSAVQQKGVRALVTDASKRLRALPPIEIFEPDYVVPEPSRDGVEDLKIEPREGVWFIEGEWLDRLVRNVNFGDYESRMYFNRALEKAGVFERLEELGIAEGDTVSVAEMEFDWKR